MSKNMRGMSFETFLKLLETLGYDKVDLELKLFLWTIEGKNVREILESPEWKNGNFNNDITDRAIVRRYYNLLDAPWVQEKYKEMVSHTSVQRQSVG